MIKLVEVAYYNDNIRCYRDGRIERLNKPHSRYGKAGTWTEVTQTSFTEGGYLQVWDCDRYEKWHRVIWTAFNGKIPDGLEVNHKDEIKTNNALSNLELLTHGDNTRYGTRNKRIGETNSANGTYKRQAEKLSKPVVGIHIKTGEQIEFPSIMEAGRNGFDQGNICSCIKGKRKSHKGYAWRYKDQI